MKMVFKMLMTTAALVSLLSMAKAEDTVVKLGMARSISSGATLIAIARGYFKQVGIKIEAEDLDSSADAIALLAQNQYQIVEGGVSAGYFNAFTKNLPIVMTSSRASSPVGHWLMIRPDLKDVIKSPKDLKGRIIASNGPGSVSTYELGKMLEPHGLTIADIDVKIFPFPQYAVAFANKAIDAGLVIPTWTSEFPQKGIALPYISADEVIKPSPITIAVTSLNTDWAKKNPEAAKNFFLAYQRGVRDYCQAYHDGSIRKEMIELLVKAGINRDPAFFDTAFWNTRSADGQINVASIMDMQEWYVKNKFTSQVFTAERVIDHSYVNYANEKLGPFVLENKESKKEGCR